MCALFDKKGLVFGIGYRSEAALLSRVAQIIISLDGVFEGSGVGCLDSALITTQQAGVMLAKVLSSPHTYLCLILPNSDAIGLASLRMNAVRVEVTSLLNRLLDKGNEGVYPI